MKQEAMDMADRASNGPVNPASPRDAAPPVDGGPRDGGPGKKGKPVLYVGRISAQTSRRDLEDLFARYGRIVALEIKHGGYGFAEF
ncbi:hypothetical protein HDU93_005682, partial [Gonapodya sp. JEL0774]